ncbi:hypothetical protein GOODEAATRI_034229 [Goodea atripinnis]|uniref:Uncharacterized protein n=1 Tax=Goodea atripinnis TaxID=208336 RepID=A0ABV0NZY5_9TELE
MKPPDVPAPPTVSPLLLPAGRLGNRSSSGGSWQVEPNTPLIMFPWCIPADEDKGRDQKSREAQLEPGSGFHTRRQQDRPSPGPLSRIPAAAAEKNSYLLQIYQLFILFCLIFTDFLTLIQQI